MTPPPAAAAAPVVEPRRPLAPRGPRRVSGPARPAQPARSRRGTREGGFALGVISALEGLAQHRLLDRLIRGRTWIAIVAFALIGIVTLQLGLLKLNGGIGRALEHESVLQRENATLSIENSDLAAGTRVQARAVQLGMAFVPTSALHFLSAPAHGDIAKAASVLNAATEAATSEASEAVAQSGESSESSESQSSAEPAQASTSGAESSAPSEASSDQGSEASSSESSASGESSASAQAGATESSAAASGEGEPASSASAETGAGGGIQATSSGE
jgi:cell division protein FtsL